MDYYRNDFDNQAIVDMEYDRRNIYFYNLRGKSYANAWQIDVNATPLKGFDIFAAFRLTDTKITYGKDNGQYFTTEKPLTNKYRDIYVGCENILNYKQKNPIIDAENPFGTDFDASRI